jgi:hypothetical protein
LKLYLLGPMTGYHNDNRDKFNEVAAELRKIGFEVLNPSELDEGLPPVPRLECYRRDIPLLCQCDAGVALPGWRKSEGARLEAFCLKSFGCPVYHWPTLRRYADSELPRLVMPGDV